MIKTSLLSILQIAISIIYYVQSANEKTVQYVSSQMREWQIPGLQLALSRQAILAALVNPVKSIRND
jgi:hypothetical protein